MNKQELLNTGSALVSLGTVLALLELAIASVVKTKRGFYGVCVIAVIVAGIVCTGMGFSIYSLFVQ